MATVPTWVEIYRSAQSRDCDERLLLLESVGIPAAMRLEDGSYGVWVAPEDAGRAYFELTRYAAENRPPPPPPPPPTLHAGALVASAGYVLVLFVLAAASANAALGRDWLGVGALDGTLVRAGEWWRAVTALTLHSDLAHFGSNAGFGALFGTLAGRVYGPGRAWLGILLAAALANLANAAWMPAGRVSLGASTAVFAALGMLAVFPWPDRRRGTRAGIRGASIVAALVLLALLGTGDERTDIAAHALGFVAGMGVGVAVPRFRGWHGLADRTAAVVVGATIVVAWAAALL